MSEEINEDNCVLSENEMQIIDESLEYVIKGMVKNGESEIITRAVEYVSNTLFQKITKLNDLAKEKGK